MLLRKISSFVLFAGALSLSLLSCKKNEHIEEIIETPEAARFNFPTANASAGYFINPATPVYKIPLGMSTVSSEARTITLSYSSPTGAAKGAQYNAPDQITIPAGKVLDTLTISGLIDGYATPGRRDTLIIKITGRDTISKKGTFRLIMQKFCPIVLNDLLGDYDNTREVFGTSAYGPYTTTITAATSLSSTTAEITVANIYDFGWNPIKFRLDWADVANLKVTVPTQTGIGNAGTLSSTYAGQDISVRAFAGQIGTFSMCDQTFSLKLQVGVTGVGFFGDLYTVNMAR